MVRLGSALLNRDSRRQKVAFLVCIQLTKAIGGEAVLDPVLAAWLPNTLFGIGGLALLARVRT